MGNQQGAEEDAKRYREGYPELAGVEEDPAHDRNLRFYRNECKCVPDGDFVDVIHERWFGRHELLERHHGYIQWLFPLREAGMNFEAQTLMRFEADAIRADDACRARVLRSYELMLDFYGMRLADKATGGIGRRAAGHAAQYENLNTSGHNFLRVTRILKSLGELGFAHYQQAWCEFFVGEVFGLGDEQSSDGHDESPPLPNCRDSLVRYWIPCVKDDSAREALLSKVQRIVQQEQQQQQQQRQ